jgi:hypothetical protein
MEYRGAVIDGLYIYAVIEADDSYIFPADVERKDLSGMDLAFLFTRWSAVDDYPIGGRDFWSSVDKSKAKGFLDGGAKCVFGWDGTIQSQNHVRNS